MSYLNREEIDWVETDFDEPTKEILTNEAIIQSIINRKAPKDFDENNADVTYIICWNEVADALNIFIKVSERSNSFYDAEIMKLHIIRNDYIKNGKKRQDYY